MKKKKYSRMVGRLFLALALSCVLGVGPGWAASADTTGTVPGLKDSLDLMFSQLDPSSCARMTPEDARVLVDIVLAGEKDKDIEVPEQKKMTGAYYPLSLKVSMERFLMYSYNPDLPGYLLVPNTVRSTQWTKVNGKKQPLPKLWESLETLDTPVVVRGVEHEQITPDISSGGYYSYDMDRLLILFRYQGKPALISVTRQCDTSDVGKKGAVVGKDSEWQYLYSGEEGLSKGGLGWVSSYMYSARSVSLFYETGTPEAPMIKGGVFKWLRAGWSGINMVRRHHIVEGCERFATAMKTILESPNLPPQDQMAKTIDLCNTLSSGELRSVVKPYFDHLQALDDPMVKKSPFKKMLRSGEYLKTLSRHDMVKILVEGYLKKMLGRKAFVDTQACRTLALQRTASVQ